jgi:hypothetical protein
MRGQSYSNKHNNSHKEDLQGGETKVMKKSLKMLLIFALVFSMFAPAMAFAAETELTAQAKYDALVEAGIFKGHGTGEAGLEENMNRGQLAVVLARLLGVDDTETSTSSSYPDVAASHWASYSIEVLTEAGVFTGHGDGTFGVNDNMTFEQIVVTTIRALGLEEDALAADLAVEGTVASWAKAHVGYALFLGLITAQADYTFEATRADLVSASYDVHLVIEASKVPTALEVASANATGVKKATVTFNRPVVNTDDATVVLKRGNIVVSGEKSWNDAKTELTITTGVSLAAGEYTVTVSGLDIEEGKNTAAFTVAPERIETIEFGEAAYKSAVTTTTTAVVSYKLKNQYGENITSNVLTSNLQINSTEGSAAFTGQGTVEITNIPNDRASLTLTLVDKTYAKTLSASLNILAGKVLSEVSLSTPEFKEGKSKLEANVTDYVVPYTAKDQYGNATLLTSGNLSQLTFVSSNTSVFDPAAANAVEVATGNKLTFDFKNFDGSKDVTVTVISNASGKASQISFTVFGNATAHTPELVAPTTKFAANDTAYKVELNVKDQYGDALTADQIVAVASDLTVTSGNTGKFTVHGTKVVKVGEKAYVQLVGVATGSAVVSVTVNATGQTASLSLEVVDPKVVTSMTLSPNYTHAVNNGVVTLKATFKDQYGDALTAPTNAVRFEVNNANFGSAPADSTLATMVSAGVSLTAADWDKTTTVTARVYAANGTDVVDTKTVTFTSVKANAALTYEVEALGTIATAGSGDTSSAYAKTISVFAKNTAGNKVALPASGVILNATSTSSAIVVDNAQGSFKVAGTGTADATASVNVTVNTNTGVNSINASVTVSKEAPQAESIVAKSGTSVVTKKTLTAAALDLFTSPVLKFEVKDQYNTTALSTTSYVTIFVKNNTSGAVTTATGGSFTFVAGVEYTVTAVTANGLTTAVTVTAE